MTGSTTLRAKQIKKAGPSLLLPENSWAIGIYSGRSALSLQPAAGVCNPVLTAADVTDAVALFVADPFMIRVDDTWHMFFELFNTGNRKGEIGLATSSDGMSWTYQQTVLQEPFHLSYPYVFEWEGEFFMTPETLGSGTTRLYRADTFPSRWSCVATIIDTPGADPSPFRFNDRWWMLVCQYPGKNDVLKLYSADSLYGPWIEHPSSPVINGDLRRARPAGRVLPSVHGRLIRFAQDCYPRYGTQIRAFQILELTSRDYLEVEVSADPLICPSGRGWNKEGMHQVDAHQTDQERWIACVDGRAWTGPLTY